MRRRRIGYILSGIAILFLSFDTAVKLLRVAPAVQANAQLGLPEHLILVVGLLELACLIVYAVPPTALIGAVLFTGYLGGAIAMQLRVGNPLFSQTLFPAYVAALIWGGLLLRHPRLVGILTGERK